MEVPSCELSESLKTLERVKGIEPSYSAWKAAALPLSYTRARGINQHAMRAASTAARRPSRAANGLCFPGILRRFRLNSGKFASYIEISINKERR